MERYPLFSKAFPYSSFAQLKISIIDAFLESRLAVDVSNWLLIWGRMVRGDFL